MALGIIQPLATADIRGMSNKENIIPASLQKSIESTFSIQLSTPAKILSVEAAEDTGKSSSIDCMSVLGLKSTEYQGALALGFPQKTFLPLVEKMIGEKYQEISKTNADACSEILNIIYASARVSINQAGYDFDPAIPTTLLGKELNLAMGAQSKYLRFSCECEYGPFLVALSLRKR